MRPLAGCVACLVPLALTGCYRLPFHRTAQVRPQALAPFAGPAQPLEVIRVELPLEYTLLHGVPIYNMREEPQPLKPPFKKKKSTLRPPEEAVEAVANVPPSVSAIGALTSGDSPNLRGQTEETIAAAERRLSGFNRSMSDSESKIADHIREFLKQARAALSSGDVEGANTLAAKAQVLLNELAK